MKSILNNNRGISLVAVLLIVLMLLGLTGTALLTSGNSSKMTSNLKTGTMAIQAADAGLRHALAIMPAAADFDSLLTGSVSGFTCSSPCNGTTNKPTLTGTLGNYSYSVVASNDTTVTGETATNDTNKIAILTSTATGTDGTTRRIQAYVQLTGGSFSTPGVLYLAGDTGVKVGVSDPDFTISGNDTNTDGTAGPGAAIPGIGLSNAAMATDVKGQIPSGDYNRITGQGYSAGPPVTPSIQNVGSLDVTALANSIISLGSEGSTLQTLSTGTFSSGTWGTAASPKITHITGDAALKGNLSGYGVLIVDGNAKVSDNFSFSGLMIFQGDKIGIKDDNLAGDAMLYGAMLWKDTNKTGVKFGKGGRMFYSTQAINAVKSAFSGAFVGTPKLIAWNEVMQ